MMNISIIAIWASILSIVVGGVTFFGALHDGYVSKVEMETRILELENKYLAKRLDIERNQ